jgi:hypothetical protein
MSDEQVQGQVADQAPVQESTPQTFDNSQATQASAPEGSGSVYDAFKSLPEFRGADDATIAQTLYQSMHGYRNAQHQLRQYQEVLPDYLRNQRQFEEWRRAQAQAQQPRQPEQPKWWNPPEVKDTWKQFIIRDPETGREIIAPDAPLDAQMALKEYQAYTANFARKFVTDPENTLKPFIEQVAMQKAQELVEKQLGQYTAQNYVQTLEQQNSDWLYDQNGQVTPEGQAIQQYIAQAAQFGINDPQARWQFATGMLERDLLNMRYQQMQQTMAQPPAPPQEQAPAAAPPAQVAQQNMQFLRERATRAPNRSGGATEPRAPRPKMTFEERLRAQLVKDGI